MKRVRESVAVASTACGELAGTIVMGKSLTIIMIRLLTQFS